MPRALHTLRQWPTTDWISQWLHSDCQVIVSEQALRAVLAEPHLLELIPCPCYCLLSEVQLLRPELREQVPAHLLQLADTAWLDLTLQCSPIISWGD